MRLNDLKYALKNFSSSALSKMVSSASERVSELRLGTFSLGLLGALGLSIINDQLDY